MNCDKRTEVELKVHELIEDALYLLTQRFICRSDWQNMMGKLQRAKIILTNKQFGCITGSHASACKCEGG